MLDTNKPFEESPHSAPARQGAGFDGVHGWAIAVLLISLPLAAQSQTMQLPASGRSLQALGGVVSQQATAYGEGATVVEPSVTAGGVYQGSVPGEAFPAGRLKLSLVEAVNLGLKTNLGIITTGAASSTARAQRMQALSQLLPRITGSAGGTETQVNLAAYGLTSLGSISFPSIAGPFHYVQAEASFNWNALSLTSIRNYQTAREVDRAARLSERDARELVVLAVGGSYLQAASTAARIEAQRLQVKYAQAIYDRAAAQLTAGTNTRVDVTRSLVQLQAGQERLLSLEGDYQQQKIALARTIGVPLDADFEFTEPLATPDLPAIAEASELQAAYDGRSDLRAAERQLKAAQQALSAARAERLPSVSFSGNYGAMGVDAGNSHGVFAATGSVTLPLFDGGAISADVRQAEATLRQRQAEYQDQRGQVEQDVRIALIRLRTAAGQVQLAELNRRYAQETLTMVQDRFNAGVTTTVEVVQAQQQEAGAENDFISSLFALNLARLTLGRATGSGEKSLGTLFPGPKH
jgi:outer membrane protein TolC